MTLIHSREVNTNLIRTSESDQVIGRVQGIKGDT